MHIINLGWKTKELQSSFLSGNPNGFEDYGPDCNGMRVTTFLGIAGQDNLPPLTPWKSVPSAVTSSISKLASPVHTYSPLLCLGQIIARGLLDVFRDFHNNEDDFLMVMEIVVQLSEDAEPTVRTELMEQIPLIDIFFTRKQMKFSSGVLQISHTHCSEVPHRSEPSAQVQVLSAALRAAQLGSVCGPEPKSAAGLRAAAPPEAGRTADSQTALLASSSGTELSAARILQHERDH
ncbi:serine/threonine-protein phosphatase 4 regulatory subunit 1-like isoform X2 [Manis pentadactyla]|uniref:serine/threonine-protein phosphatase 4 regulatory subunit 1-like isoform X2 n=1 Tax=Manis pentadactyla TaxID=143292 RepID=UPI00255C9ABE|nr:serine/threonine-protein phosphatase 4 regulatory subunit 1-like isoform X2 [Manis pentadactyla]